MVNENTVTLMGRANEAHDHRAKLIATLPVAEKQMQAGGISTTFLEAGDGPPLLLLHGPGESSLWWMRVIPGLARQYRVIAPDLPGHGATGIPAKTLDENALFAWLDAVVQANCRVAPVAIGHVLGGAIALHYALKAPEKLAQLMLVDTLGLGSFRPAPLFAYQLFRFMLRPTEKNYLRFLPHCMYNIEALRRQMGENWEPFLAYNLACARKPGGKAAVKSLMQKIGMAKISEKALATLHMPVSLIWGRHDQANKVQIALEASQKLGWPLHILENSRDDPKMEQPEAFVSLVSYLITNKNNRLSTSG